MFARMTTFKLKIDKLEEATKIFDEKIIPITKTQKGYCGAYWMIDRKAGKAIAIAFWDSEQDAAANEQSGYYQEQVIKLLECFAAPPIREGYEVISQA